MYYKRNYIIEYLKKCQMLGDIGELKRVELLELVENRAELKYFIIYNYLCM